MHLHELSPTEHIVYCAYTFVRNFRFHGQPALSEIGQIFEDHFRTTLAGHVPVTFISAKRDMGMGLSLHSWSGLQHELDVIACRHRDLYIFELKYYFEDTITKDMVVVFLQKILDFYIANPDTLWQLRLHPIFLARSAVVPDAVRQFCAMWGILVIDLQYYCPPMSALVMRIIQQDVGLPVIDAWVRPYHFAFLLNRAEYLTLQMARSLTTTLIPACAGEGKGLYLNTEQLPSSRIAAKWVGQQKELSRSMKTLKEQFVLWQRSNPR